MTDQERQAVMAHLENRDARLGIEFDPEHAAKLIGLAEEYKMTAAELMR